MIPIRIYIYGALLVALALGGWRLHHVIDQQGYNRAKTESVAAADKANALAQTRQDAQAASAQAAATEYEKQASATETQLKATRHDLYAATENLASCQLSSVAVGLLNDAGSDNAAKP